MGLVGTVTTFKLKASFIYKLLKEWFQIIKNSNICMYVCNMFKKNPPEQNFKNICCLCNYCKHFHNYNLIALFFSYINLHATSYSPTLLVNEWLSIKRRCIKINKRSVTIRRLRKSQRYSRDTLLRTWDFGLRVVAEG